MAPAGDGSFNPIGSGLAAFYLPQKDLAVTLTFHDPVPMDKLPATASITVVQPPQKAGQSMRILREQADIPVVRQKFGNQWEMITSRPLTVNGVRLALLLRRVTGLNIGHNPAVPFIFTSFILILVGLVSVLYFPFTRLWLYVGRQDSPVPASVVWLRGSSEKSKQGFKRRFDLIAQRVQQQLLSAATAARVAGVQEP
jgi:cytochrome c biogenesis protein ResB